MPTIALTDRKVAGLKATPDKQMDYFDRSFPGFGVRVSQHGRKTFILMYRNAERRFTRLTLGTYGQYDTDLTLAKAREKARAELRKATEGRDPATERKTARAQTFGALADFYLEKHAKRHKRSWRDDARMIRQELDVWAHKPAAGIRRADVRELLERIVQRGAPVLANRVLALVRKMLNFAIDQEWIDANPAAKMPRPGGKELARVDDDLGRHSAPSVAKVLNHVSADAGVTAIYDRHSYDAEKRVALETWERTLLGIVKQKTGGKVKAFAKRA
jgi:Arm DNA-binding domain